MEFLEWVFGTGEAKDLTILQMAARAVAVYIMTLVIIRLGKKRFMGRATAFDVIVGIVLGSIASRAITGNAPMIPSMASAAVVMALHWLFSALAVRWHRFGWMIKGGNTVIVRDGKVDEEALCAAHMSSRDLEESLREQGASDVSGIAEARLERDGSVSVIKKPAAPRIFEIDVAPGVQTIRVEFA